MDLKSVISQLQRESARDIDVLIAPNNIDVDTQGRIVHRERAYSFTLHSYRQWCRTLEIPDHFLKRCPRGDGPASQKAIFDHFRGNRDKDVMLRLRPGERNVVRAVLPGRYNILDNAELLERLDSFMGDVEMHVEDVKVSNGNLDVRALGPKPIAIGRLKGGEPDVHKFGYFLRNSEVGQISDVRANFLVYRNACTNGMVLSSNFINARKKTPLLSALHTKPIPDIVTLLETSFVEFQRRAPKARAALERSQSIVLTVPEAERQLNRLLDRLNIGIEFDALVAKEFKNEPTLSRFGVAQALTAAARSMPVRVRSRVEEEVGDYVMKS